MAPVKTCQVDLQAPLISRRREINTPSVPSAASQSKQTVLPSRPPPPLLASLSFPPGAADTSTFDKVITSFLTPAAEVKADCRMVETRFQGDECSQKQAGCVCWCLFGYQRWTHPCCQVQTLVLWKWKRLRGHRKTCLYHSVLDLEFLWSCVKRCETFAGRRLYLWLVWKWKLKIHFC